jgi:hypothetical protein
VPHKESGELEQGERHHGDVMLGAGGKVDCGVWCLLSNSLCLGVLVSVAGYYFIVGFCRGLVRFGEVSM